ncbi:MAG TPA: HPr family phosphocarrier protein [Blastocatellia bacterium]|nr:HPr family phosphocarrier protein [Blastocatellia bacterium]
MQQRTVTITNRLGLHARAAARLVKLAAAFNSRISLSRCDGREASADARSILAVLMLAATQNTQLQITTEGEDEVMAMEALCSLIADRFGEN